MASSKALAFFFCGMIVMAVSEERSNGVWCGSVTLRRGGAARCARVLRASGGGHTTCRCGQSDTLGGIPTSLQHPYLSNNPARRTQAVGGADAKLFPSFGGKGANSTAVDDHKNINGLADRANNLSESAPVFDSFRRPP